MLKTKRIMQHLLMQLRIWSILSRQTGGFDGNLRPLCKETLPSSLTTLRLSSTSYISQVYQGNTCPWCCQLTCLNSLSLLNISIFPTMGGPLPTFNYSTLGWSVVPLHSSKGFAKIVIGVWQRSRPHVPQTWRISSGTSKVWPPLLYNKFRHVYRFAFSCKNKGEERMKVRSSESRWRFWCTSFRSLAAHYYNNAIAQYEYK